MLDKLNSSISRTTCFFFGHKVYRNVYSGKTGYYSSYIGGAQITPLADRERVDACLRCGKQLGPQDERDKTENYKGL